jgi:hypothetical protein
VAHLACRTCGRQIYTVASLDALFAEERRCPGCGSGLQSERRTIDRRVLIRRQYVPDLDPTREERLGDRRQLRRRQTVAATGTNRPYGWTARYEP